MSGMLPRLVVAGLSGESGKTLVSIGLLLAARRAGLAVRAFKKGPDYIDAGWLTWASGNPARNLDTFLMGFNRTVSSFALHAVPSGLNVIEGNRGLYDGVDARGTHSTAELSKALQAPVVLVLNATKVTRTAAALVLGCRHLDPRVAIAGVILNQVGGSRHEQVLRHSIESACDVPVLGVIPRAQSGEMLPERHLGLVTPEDHPALGSLQQQVFALTENRLDFEKLLRLARMAPPLGLPGDAGDKPPDGRGLRLAYLKDSAFSFYYPENLEALSATGAKLIPVSALWSSSLPEDVDALYIGGGFPEVYGAALSKNTTFLASVKRAASHGLPIYAECGGLMLLARAILWEGNRYQMAGVLPVDVEVCRRPQGHGYTELVVDTPNAFFPLGTRLKGHEFHYSHILLDGKPMETACAVRRGTGCYPQRDAVILNNLWASYTHLHEFATPEWVSGIVTAARCFASVPVY